MTARGGAEHGFPDMRTIVIGKQDFGGLAPREATAQVRRSHDSRYPATHNDDTVHRFFSCPLPKPHFATA